MGHMKAHANPDELHLLGQAQVQPLEEEVEAYAVEAFAVEAYALEEGCFGC